MNTFKGYILPALTLFLTTFSSSIEAQLLQGQWRDHLSYYAASRIADDGKTLYCATEIGLLSLDRENNELNKHSKVNGLSDVGISTIGYDNNSETVLIAYTNGNLDLWRKDGEIINISDIERKSIVGSKSTNSIYFFEGNAYLACGFGIVVFNMLASEVIDTYMFGDGGTPIDVSDVTIHKNTIYAATESGIYKADLSSPNLVDFQYWDRLMFIPQPTSSYKLVESFNNKLLCVYTDESSEEDKIISINSETYSNWDQSYNSTVTDICYANNMLGISSSDRAQVFNSQGNLMEDFTVYGINHVYIDADGQIYLATQGAGFRRYENGNFKYLIPNGPRFNEVSKVVTSGEHIWVSSGGPHRPYKHGAAHTFENGKWKSFTASDIPSYQPLGNTHKFAIDPQDENHVYAGTHMYGVIEFMNGEMVKVMDHTNTEIFSHISDEVSVRVAGMDFDESNNLWIVLDYVPQSLFCLSADGKWSNPEVTSLHLVDGNTEFTDLLVTSNNQIWISTLTKGLIVLEEDSEGNFTEKSFSIVSGDDIISRSYCLREDQDGNVLVGTNEGPVRYYSTQTVFQSSTVIGVREKIPRNDGTDLADYVLGSNVILDIAVDGGNRIWCATESSGVFLLDSDAKTTLKNFREENSEILSNAVTGIGINEVTGEVFFATNSGLVSYMGSATKGFDDYSDVYVFPNPVRPEYDGIITITGLIENTIVKITDLSGNLVWETNSLGGQAIWDGKNFKGRRVASGIYLVMLAIPDGSKSHLTKLLFLN